MTHRAINWALAAMICLLMGSLYRLDGPSDIQAAQDTELSTADAITAAQQQARFERAARRACADVYTVAVQGQQISCLDQAGKPIHTVQVAL